MAGSGLATRARVVVDGHLLSLGGRPFRLRGTLYGSSATREDGASFPNPNRVLGDFIAIADAGLNTVRTRGLPPRDVLELAAELGLQVLVGLEYRDWAVEPAGGTRVHERVREAGLRAVESALARCAGRPEVLAISVGRELAVDVLRAHGEDAVEETLAELAEEIRSQAYGVLATYTSSGPGFRIGSLDFACFALADPRPPQFRAEIRRLRVRSGQLPIVVTGAAPAQLRLVEQLGCAGAVIGAWNGD